jgi:signal transduction histidine kinase
MRSTRDSIIDEQLRLLMRSPFPIYAATATTVLSAATLTGELPPVPLYGWAVAMVTLQVLRYAVWRRFRGFSRDDGRAIHWAWPVTVLMSGCGLLWGFFALGFYEVHDSEMRVFMLFVVTSMMTGGAVSFTAYLPAYFGYLLGATVPIAVTFLWHGTSTSLLMGGITAVYISVLIAMARAANRGVTELIELQLEKAALVSDLRLAKDAAEQASSVKSNFLANMSHELRTPLNAIIGFSDVIRRQLFGPIGNTRYQDYVGDINRSGHHLLRLVNDILDVSKLEAGAMELAEDLFDLGQIVTDCAKFVRTEVASNHLVLTIDMPPSLPFLCADELRFKQIVLNLLSNAVKFSRAGGRVGVAARLVEDGGVALIVRDSGIGMTAAEIAVALQPFRQVENATTRRYAGTGLGLPLAKSLIERHGGTLSIVSERNIGTSVTVHVPAYRVARDEARTEPQLAVG